MSSSPSWSPPPSFTKVSRGYWEYEVDRLIDDLKEADLAGEPMGPIVSRRKLSEVGFGYDSSEVDSYLAMLCGVLDVPDTGTPASGMLINADGQRGERQPSVPEMPRLSQTVELGSMLTEINGARLKRSSQRTEAGYDAQDVDDFLSRMTTMIRSGQPIKGTLQNCRFRMARRGVSAYDVGEVDSLLDRLEALSSKAGSARQGLTMNSSARTTRSVDVTLTKSRKSVAIFIFVIVVLMTVLVLPTIFFSVVLPLFMD